MTGRTHDLAAFTTLTLLLTVQPIPQMSLATALTALGANMIGGITPDLDQPTAKLWNSVPTGSLFGRLIDPLLGGHRMITHSLLGMGLIGWGLKFLLAKIGRVVLVDMNLVWWAFMLGYLSHLIADTLTKEGVPWLFPIPIRFGIPPLKALRITTGGLIEKVIVFPALLVANGYLFYMHYGLFLAATRLIVAK
jgi:inner membrane protein